MERMLKDAAYAFRIMRKSAVFTGTAIVTLAIAIGANTAVFTTVRAVLLEPLPYASPNQLVRLTGAATPTRYRAMQAGIEGILNIGAYTREENVTLAGIREPEVLRGVHVSSNFLQILRVRPVLGREFSASDDLPGGEPVAMISSELWRRVYGSDPRVIGRSAELDSKIYTIVGVLPDKFVFPEPGLDIWMPAPSELPSMSAGSRALSPFLSLFGRLEPGVSESVANARLTALRQQYGTNYPSMLDAKAKSRQELSPLKEELIGHVRSMLWLLFGAVTFVLLIACSNVASLLLTRSVVREREFAVRSSVGASRGRLALQLITESVLLSLLGGLGGVALAPLLLHGMPLLGHLKLPRSEEIRMNWPVFCFAAAVSAVSGLLFGLAPALKVSREDLVTPLRASGTPAGGGSSLRTLIDIRTGVSLVQVALSTVLLIGTMLLIKSVSNLRNVPIGFDAEHLLTTTVTLPPARYNADAKIALFFQKLTKQLNLLPGVQGAAAAMSLPMMNFPGIPVQDASKPKLRLNERLIAKYFPVTPGYFRTLKIPIVRGREFSDRDGAKAQRVAVIDESLARHLWPSYPQGVDPVGQRLLVGGLNPNPALIVGVAKDVKQNLDDREDWRESVYVSFLQAPTLTAVMAVRTTGPPLSALQSVRREVSLLDSSQAVSNAQTMNDLIDAQLGNRSVLLKVLTAFASMAVLLAVVGLYGVIAYLVSQKIQEIGLRRALGAQDRDILCLLLFRAALSSLLGVGVGVIAALGLTRLMASELFEVRATDPTTFLMVAMAFFVVSLLASFVPAYRATKIDPAVALRV